MFCPHCGAEIENGSAFCPLCGEKVEPTAQDLSCLPSPAQTIKNTVSSPLYAVGAGAVSGAALLALLNLVIPYLILPLWSYFFGNDATLTFFSYFYPQYNSVLMSRLDLLAVQVLSSLPLIVVLALKATAHWRIFAAARDKSRPGMNERVFDFLKVILLVEAGVSACSLVSACISAGYSASRYGAFTIYSFFVIFPSLWNVCVAACTIWLNVALARRINAVKHALEGDAPLCDLPLYPGVLLCVLSATSLLSLPSAVAYAVFTVLYFLFRKKMRVFS